MAGKRSAGSDLNHTNWDQDDEPEDAGSFKKASQEVLQKRVIKTAKRRNPISSNSESNAKSVFGSFTGFNKLPTTSSSSGFSFLNNITKDNSPEVNGVNSSPNISKEPNNVNNSMFKVPENKTSNNEQENEYYAKLKGLNESVSNWIKKHVDSNPFVNLKPIFKDYEKYFDELETVKVNVSSDKTKTSNLSTKSNDDSSIFNKELGSFASKSKETTKKENLENKLATPQFSFGFNSKKNENSLTFGAKTETDTSSTKTEAKETPTFNFGSNLATKSAPTFSFGTDPKTSAGLNIGSPASKPFTFSNVTRPSDNERKTGQEAEEEESDEPPKVEFVPVVEDGHTYTVRCKVFVKNQDTFGDRGIGTLYLKPIPDTEKTQLVVRADTNLGNLLCNFILSKSIPTKRMGKKDVMLVCVPTPETKPPPVPILLRVKSPEQADELLMELEKHKK